MRRRDRAITEFHDIVKVMKACKVCHVAFHDDEYPYVAPMTFGLEVKDNEEVSIYFFFPLYIFIQHSLNNYDQNTMFTN
ncbi:hypothetical protein CFSAN002367_06635 [Clostridium botulinum CFSAN002367]|nr:hypothetical protein CFSAN002367_06635 [Clostridium botulinum CFSAN002367]